MNLLVTNSQCSQAYMIMRCLRSDARRIVATMNGTNWLRARTTHAARSKYVDARYVVPYCARDWLAGRIQHENTEAEESFVRRIEEICRKEKIDTIFPSFDPEVYVFSKNLERFRRQGILVVGPDYERLMIPLDKYNSVRAAEKAGVPVPRSIVPADMEELRRVAPELGPPWVIKPRMTAGSQGTTYVDDPAKLESTYAKVSAAHHRPMLQEFIPGWMTRNFYLMADRDSEIVSILSPDVLRTSKRLFRDSTAVCVSRTTPPLLAEVRQLVREIGWRGGLTIQTKIDARDGKPKLMEINPRLGSALWRRTELGVNEPLAYLRIARGEPVGELPAYPDGVLLLEPLDDILNITLELLDIAVFRFRTRVLGRAPIDPDNLPRPLREVMHAYTSAYFNRQPKALIPYTRYLASDPVACLLWYYQATGYWLRNLRKIGH